MPSIGGTELVIILVFAFLLFGPDKLPQMGRTIGRALRQFRETQEKLTNVVQTEVVDPIAAAANAPTQKAAAADDEDADIVPDDEDGDIAEGEAAAAPRRKETFAERRARLAAEKAQREGAEGDGAAKDAQEPSEADAPASSTEQPVAESAAEPVSAAADADAEPQDGEPAEITTEDLYARRPRKRRTPKDDEISAAADAEGGEQ